jgi:hypothetical protein
MIGRIVVALMLAFGGGQAVAAQSALPDGVGDAIEVSVVHLRGLDTLNGVTQDIVVRVGETTRFGHLEIIAESCRVPRDAPTADAYVFLRIRDVREPAPRFSGWMFASSPALSSLDHPRYDVWVESCSNS